MHRGQSPGFSEVIISPQVLVVEDERLVAADIQEHLEKLGYAVPRVMATGEDAIRSATETRPDLVLMDIQLKGHIDGIQTAQILQTRLNVPVIYVTAFADDHTLQRAKNTEPYGYVLKPFGKKELQTAIELALHKHNRERRLRTNEQWLLGLLASTQVAILATDHAGLICMMNPQAEEYTGAQLSGALGSHWSEFIEFEKTPAGTSECPIRKAVEANAGSEMIDCRVFYPKTRHHALVCGAVSPMPEPSSNRRAAVLVFRDVTSSRHLEAQYYRTRHLENMQRLAGGLAHQFSNFMTLVSGYAESLAHSIEPVDPRFHDVRTIQRVSERATNLTRELMAFSRNQQLNLKVLDTNQAVANGTDLLKLTSNPAIALEHDFDPQAAKIEADPAHLDQILTTLVSNARDAMPEGGIITIRTSNMEVDESLANKFVDLPAGSYVRIDVIDRGMGMTYETQTHIFEPFFTTKERVRGTGIGLAATYGLVKQNRGHIWFESEPKKGTTFSVCLPRAGSLASVPRSLFGTETVLVVEDSPEARTNARDMLLDLGYHVIEASCGSEAVKVCEQTQERIDLVLSNVMMPNMTASELASRLASLRPGARILFMSPYSEYSLRRHGALDPSFAVIQRPFNIDALARAVRNRLSGTPQVLTLN